MEGVAGSFCALAPALNCLCPMRVFSWRLERARDKVKLRESDNKYPQHTNPRSMGRAANFSARWFSGRIYDYGRNTVRTVDGKRDMR